MTIQKYELAALIRMNGAVGILNRQLILNIKRKTRRLPDSLCAL